MVGAQEEATEAMVVVDPTVVVDRTEVAGTGRAVIHLEVVGPTGEEDMGEAVEIATEEVEADMEEVEVDMEEAVATLVGVKENL